MKPSRWELFIVIPYQEIINIGLEHSLQTVQFAHLLHKEKICKDWWIKDRNQFALRVPIKMKLII